MDAVLFLKELNRLTDGCAIDCKNCPLYGFNNGKKMDCEAFRLAYPEKTVEIVEKWSRENPVKTMMDDFFEKFPNAPKEDSGAPFGCPWEMGYCERDSEICDNLSCGECWSRPLEVKE